MRHRLIVGSIVAVLAVGTASCSALGNVVSDGPEDQIRATLSASLYEIRDGLEEFAAFYEKVPLGETIGEFYSWMEAYAPELDAIIERIEQATGDFDLAVSDAIDKGLVDRLGLDPDLATEVVGNLSLWTTAQRVQNDPGMCRESLPAGSDDWPVDSLQGQPEYAACVVELMESPIVQLAGQAGALVVLQLEQLARQLGL